MPLQYSIQEKHPTIKHGPGSVEYVPVPREVAETHDEGCFALFNDEGEKVSNWCLISRKIYPDKASTRTNVKDAIMQPLTEGDYVAYNNSGGISPMSIGKVTGFTNKQVRVLPMNTNRTASSKLMYESAVIKLPESFWHGTV
jgi:hypothetical protein